MAACRQGRQPRVLRRLTHSYVRSPFISTQAYSQTMSEEDSRKPTFNIGFWIAIGAGLGVALGAALGNIAVWTAVGAGVGVALGAGFSGAKRGW